MLAKSECYIVAELGRLQLCDASLVSSNRCKAGPCTEVEGRKCIGRRMLADVYAGQIELIQGCRSLDGKPTLVMTLVKPKRNSFRSFGGIA
jgi:hypothetical protein